MMRTGSLLATLLAIGTLAGCGDDRPRLQDPSGRFQVIGQCAPRTLAAAIGQHAGAKLVIAFDQSPAALIPAIAEAGRETAPYLVTISTEPGDDEPIGDAVIAPRTGAAEAVELSAFASRGARITPKPVDLGPRVLTAANRQLGGRVALSAGDFYMATMRSENLRGSDGASAETPIAVLLLLADDLQPAWRQRIADEAKRAADDHAEMRLDVVAGADLAAAARDGIANGARAVLLATSDPQASADVKAACDAAGEAAPTLIVLDPLLASTHQTCCIGCSPTALGAAAKHEVQHLLADGGAIVTCVEVDTSPLTSARQQAFEQAMQFRP